MEGPCGGAHSCGGLSRVEDGNVHSRNSFLRYPLPARERMELDHDKDLTGSHSGRVRYAGPHAGPETEISSLELLMTVRHKRRVLKRVHNLQSYATN